MEKAAEQLSNIFQDPYFAWQLLSAQIQIEMANIASGQTIAYLLQLYMRGVQKMNSLADPRQSYFKNKVTSLMTKQTVIKSLKENPMKKKSKPDQVPAKQIKQTQKKQRKQPKTEQKQQKKKPEVKQINQLQLQQKRKQLQMRMAYVAQQHGPDSLKKILAQQDNRQKNISTKINKIINSHEQRLNQRIRQRKLRTSTFRSHSQVNIQQNQNPFNSAQKQQKQMEQSFSPFKQLVLQNFKKIQSITQSESPKQKYTRKSRSLGALFNMSESPTKKIRKYTFDQTISNARVQ